MQQSLIQKKNELLRKEVQALKQQLEAVYGELYKSKRSKQGN